MTTFHIEIEDRADAAGRIELAMDTIARFGGIEGDHHRAWVIDQAVRALVGPQYDEWVREQNAGEDGPETYAWDVGIAP